MRKFFNTLAMVVFATSLMAFSCQKEEDVIPFGNLPTVAQSFVSQYFGKATVTKAETESNGGYSVDLSNGVEVDFDATGTWTKVDAPDTQDLSALATSTAFIPKTIVEYVTANYPKNPINGIEKKANGYEVELVGIAEDIYFNAEGKSVTTQPTDNSGNITPATIPATVQNTATEFLNKNFYGVAVTRTEVKNNEVEYNLANGVEVDFDLNGNWIRVDAPDGKSIPTDFIPSAITNYVKANYPNNTFNSIEKRSNGYEVELVGVNKDLIFDLNGNFVRLN